MPSSYPTLPTIGQRSPREWALAARRRHQEESVGITPAIANVLQRPGAVGSADSHLSAADTDDTGFDPADHTVEDVKAYVEANPDEAELVLAAEAEGKDRSTLIAWLNDFLNSQADDGG